MANFDLEKEKRKNDLFDNCKEAGAEILQKIEASQENNTNLTKSDFSELREKARKCFFVWKKENCKNFLLAVGACLISFFVTKIPFFQNNYFINFILASAILIFALFFLKKNKKPCLIEYINFLVLTADNNKRQGVLEAVFPTKFWGEDYKIKFKWVLFSFFVGIIAVFTFFAYKTGNNSYSFIVAFVYFFAFLFNYTVIKIKRGGKK